MATPSQKEIIVVKIGGAAGTLDNLPALSADIFHLTQQDKNVIVVHGCSEAAQKHMQANGQVENMVILPSGAKTRYTPPDVLQSFTAGSQEVNVRVTEALRSAGLLAVGFLGMTNGAVIGERQPNLILTTPRRMVARDNFAGSPVRVDETLFRELLLQGQVPVVGSPIQSEEGEAINANADKIAALLAWQLQCSALVLLTNQPGILRDPQSASSLYPRLTLPSLEKRALEGLGITGGMVSKVSAAKSALESGVPLAVISDGRTSEAVTSALAGAAGTRILR